MRRARGLDFMSKQLEIRFRCQRHKGFAIPATDMVGWPIKEAQITFIELDRWTMRNRHNGQATRLQHPLNSLNDSHDVFHMFDALKCEYCVERSTVAGTGCQLKNSGGLCVDSKLAQFVYRMGYVVRCNNSIRAESGNPHHSFDKLSHASP